MLRSRVIRLGLFQLVAGALSVLFLGVLNRVMRVEMGLDLFIVSLLIGGGHYLGALIAIPFGFYSDSHPVGGYRRTPYVLGGIAAAALILIGAPWVGWWVAISPSLDRITLGFLYFLIEGISTYIAGTAYLALVTDLTTREERGRVTGVIWTMLMLGIILSGAGSSIAFARYSFDGLVGLFIGAALAGVLLAWIALWKQETRMAGEIKARPITLRRSVASLLTNHQARWFAAFLLTSMFSLFMYDVILEPFGGEVFGLSPAETTRFNAYLGIGLITAMVVGGTKIVPRWGKRWTTGVGVIFTVIAFAGLAFSALSLSGSILLFMIVILGAGAGLFTVGGIALMMDMTPASQTGLFIGAWTLIQALARGPSSFAGGALQSIFLSTGSTPGEAYAYVFAIEGTGLLLSLLFLQKVNVEEFQSEVVEINITAVEAL
jgi:BCD family chlorophyll transporter-like MFS transporter